MFKFPSYFFTILIALLSIVMLPNCMHCFRISPERAINQALDTLQDVRYQFGAAFEIMSDAPAAKKDAELQAHVIMTMQELGLSTKGYVDWLFDVDHIYEMYPFVYYQKMIDGYVERIIKVQKDLVSCKYAESTARRMRLHVSELEDETSDIIYQLKALRRFVVSHERYWIEKEKLEKREQERRELLLKQERNAIERERLYLEREKLKQKKNEAQANKRQAHRESDIYDITIVQYYD